VQPLSEWKSKSIAYSECVFAEFGIQHARRMRHIITCGLSGSTVFFHNLSWTSRFSVGKTLLNIRCVFWASLQNCPKHFSEEFSQTLPSMHTRHHAKYSYSCHILLTLKFSRHSWRKIDQLDVTCFIISLFTAQHVSNVRTSIMRSLRIIVDLLLWFDVCWCYGVVRLGWGGILMQAEALGPQPA
jgi:hypothetical protein